MLGKNWFSLLLDETNSTHEKEKFNLLTSGRVDVIENDEAHIQCKNNEKKIIGWTHSVLYDEAGKISGTLSSGEDITQRKLAEMELIKSEQNLRTLIDQSPIGIITIDINGVITDANPQGLSYLKLATQTNVIGKNIQTLSPLFNNNDEAGFPKGYRDQRIPGTRILDKIE